MVRGDKTVRGGGDKIVGVKVRVKVSGEGIQLQDMSDYLIKYIILIYLCMKVIARTFISRALILQTQYNTGNIINALFFFGSDRYMLERRDVKYTHPF